MRKLMLWRTRPTNQHTCSPPWRPLLEVRAWKETPELNATPRNSPHTFSNKFSRSWPFRHLQNLRQRRVMFCGKSPHEENCLFFFGCYRDTMMKNQREETRRRLNSFLQISHPFRIISNIFRHQYLFIADETRHGGPQMGMKNTEQSINIMIYRKKLNCILYHTISNPNYPN